MGPVLEKQLRDNGFDVTFKLYDPDTNPFFDLVRPGKADMWIIVHCGSSREPYGTLQHFHSRFNSPAQGQQNIYIWANSQYIESRVRRDHQSDGRDACRRPPIPTYVDLASQAINHLPARRRGDHAGRRTPRGHLQQHLLDGLDERVEPVRGAVQPVGAVHPVVPEDRARARAVTLRSRR